MRWLLLFFLCGPCLAGMYKTTLKAISKVPTVNKSIKELPIPLKVIGLMAATKFKYKVEGYTVHFNRKSKETSLSHSWEF